MQQIDIRWLVVALVGSALLVIFRRAFAWSGTRHDKLFLQVDPHDPKTRTDYADIYMVLGVGGLVVSTLLILLKVFLG